MKSELEKIPSVGKKVASYIEELGIKNFQDLKRANPEKMYIHSCVLYRFAME